MRSLVLFALSIIAPAATAEPITTLGIPPPLGACESALGVAPESCCWPGQRWSPYLEVCLGVPRCPTGMQAVGERCVRCPAGRVVGDETSGRCCWPRQVWSRVAGACVGIPRCPSGLVAAGERCVRPRPIAIVGAPTVVEDRDDLIRLALASVDDDALDVTVRSRLGRSSCVTPCETRVLPGDVRVSVRQPNGAAWRHTVHVDEPSSLSLRGQRPWMVLAGALLLVQSFVGILASVLIAAHFSDGTDAIAPGVIAISSFGFGLPLLLGGADESVELAPLVRF